MGDYDGNPDYCSFLRETSLRDVKLAKPLNYSQYPTVPLGLVWVGNGTCVWEGCKRSVVRGVQTFVVSYLIRCERDVWNKWEGLAMMRTN